MTKSLNIWMNEGVAAEAVTLVRCVGMLTNNLRKEDGKLLAT